VISVRNIAARWGYVEMVNFLLSNKEPHDINKGSQYF
jgi:hypothetical protein